MENKNAGGQIKVDEDKTIAESTNQSGLWSTSLFSINTYNVTNTGRKTLKKTGTWCNYTGFFINNIFDFAHNILIAIAVPTADNRTHRYWAGSIKFMYSINVWITAGPPYNGRRYVKFGTSNLTISNS